MVNRFLRIAAVNGWLSPRRTLVASVLAAITSVVGFVLLLASALQLTGAILDIGTPRSTRLPWLALPLIAAGIGAAAVIPRFKASVVIPTAGATSLGMVVAALLAVGPAWSQAATPFAVMVASVAVSLGVAAIAFLTGPWSRVLRGRVGGSSPLELVAVATLVGFFTLLAGRHLSIGGVFTYDEAIYASTARSWIEGGPTSAWNVFRAPGLPLIGTLSIQLEQGTTEWVLRIWGLAAGIAVILLSWLLARRLAGGPAALIVAAALTMVTELHAQSARFLTDVPAVAVLLMLALIVTRFAHHGRAGWILVLAAPVAAAAFYLRYGSAPAIVFIGIAAIVAWPRRFREASRQVAAACLLLLVLLLPHLYESVAVTGSPWGIIADAQSQVATQDALGSLDQFVDWLADRQGGFFGAVLMAAGAAAWLGTLALAALRRQWSPVSQRLTFLVPPAIALTLLLSVAAHAEARYIFLPVVQLLIAGGVAVAMVMDHLRQRQRWLVASVGVAAALVWGMDGSVNSVEVQAAYAPTQWDIVDAGHAVRSDADGECVVITDLRPQLTWYSGCRTVGFGTESHAGPADGAVEDRYLLVYSGGGASVSDRDDIERHLASGCHAPAILIFDQASGDEAGRIYPLQRGCAPAAKP